MTVQVRAKKGGEFGANGEWYEGGKFINTIKENNKRSGSRARNRGPRKVEIEPYVWVMQPHENATPLYHHIKQVGRFKCQWTNTKEYKPFFELFARTGKAHGYTLEQIQSYCDRYNAGERWE